MIKYLGYHKEVYTSILVIIPFLTKLTLHSRPVCLLFQTMNPELRSNYFYYIGFRRNHRNSSFLAIGKLRLIRRSPCVHKCACTLMWYQYYHQRLKDAGLVTSLWQNYNFLLFSVYPLLSGCGQFPGVRIRHIAINLECLFPLFC